ncbi:MAG: hypothetical protein ABDH37_04485 [Candidatus Hydrothermales bacterium]
MKRFFVIFIFLTSCITMNVFEGPDTTKKGEASFGIGVSQMAFLDEENKTEFLPIPFPYFKGRYGIANNIDIGFRYVGIMGFGIDPKFKFLDKELKASLSFPFILATWPGLPVWYTFEPTLILGTDVIYFGSKFSYFSIGFEWDDDSVGIYGVFPSLFLGFTLGKKLRLCPEVSFCLPAKIRIGKEEKELLWRPAFSYGIGILYMP